MLRREAVKLMGSLFGLGAGTPSRFPYPDRPQPSPGIGPSQGQVVRARLVVISGAGSGLFVYSGTPAFGNLVGSITSSAGTDPYGNAFLSGITEYQTAGTNLAVQLAAGGIGYYFAPSAAGPWTSPLDISMGAGTHDLVVTNLTAGIRLLAQSGFVTVIDSSHADIAPSGDVTGVTDSATINNVLAAGMHVTLLPGTWSIAGPVVLLAGMTLDRTGATVQPGSSWAGAAMFTWTGGDVTIHGGIDYGGTAVTANNPAADVFAPGAGATNWTITDVTARNINGWIVNPTITGSFHASITRLRGNACNGGIQLTQGTGNTTVAGECAVIDANIQNCTGNPALFIQGITDFKASCLDLSVDGNLNLTGSTVVLQGACGGGIAELDAGVINGGNAGVPVVLITTFGGGSPSNWAIAGNAVQQGGVGVQVAGAVARMRFFGLMVQQCLGSGWLFTGTVPGPAATGSMVALIGCAGNGNKTAAGNGYDVEVAAGATAHVLLDGFGYGSTLATDGLIVPAGNHVSNTGPTFPDGHGVTGVPAGW